MPTINQLLRHCRGAKRHKTRTRASNQCTQKFGVCPRVSPLSEKKDFLPVTHRSAHVTLPNYSNDVTSRSASRIQCRTVVSDYRKNDFNERLAESNQFRDIHFPKLQPKFHEVSSLRDSFELALNEVEVVKIEDKMLEAYHSLKTSHEENKGRDILKEVSKSLSKVIPKEFERVE